jgi:hypothetical protein
MRLKKSNAVDRIPERVPEETRPEVPALPELAAAINTRNRYEEVKTGPARGNELLSLLEKLRCWDEDFPPIEVPIPTY